MKQLNSLTPYVLCPLVAALGAITLGFSSMAFGYGGSNEATSEEETQKTQTINSPSPGLVFVDYRSLDGGKDGVALMDLDPDSENFGQILQNLPIGEGVLPHHLYFNQDQTRLYTTALIGDRLYEILLSRDAYGMPTMEGYVPIDTGNSAVAEDIYFTEDGSRYYVTFMGGELENGGLPDAGGSIGVFDAATNLKIKTITAPVPEGLNAVTNPGPLPEPFLLYPHGISANEELGLMMVTSTIHPDLTTGVGDTVTLLDMNNNDELLKTYWVTDQPGSGSAPVEVLLLRDGYPNLALVNTMLGGDIWMTSLNESTGMYNEFEKVLEGTDQGVSWALEFYIKENRSGEDELFVSFGIPGQINVYGLNDLPNLTLKRTIPTKGLGAHHMSFFETSSGREAVIVQNNLLDLEGLNSGLLSVLDTQNGELLGEVNLREQGILPESVESAYGHGHDVHH